MDNTLIDISENLFSLIIRIHRTTFSQDELVKCMPLPPSHVKVIFYLVHHGQEATVSKIAESLRISKPNMTPIIDNLISEGLVERLQDPKDRRKILIKLTTKGLELLENHKKIMLKNLNSKISTLPKEDIDTLKESTSNLLKILDKF
ncbi:MAG: MarR family transcriptional regulator [Clostridium sp.]